MQLETQRVISQEICDDTMAGVAAQIAIPDPNDKESSKLHLSSRRRWDPEEAKHLLEATILKS